MKKRIFVMRGGNLSGFEYDEKKISRSKLVKRQRPWFIQRICNYIENKRGNFIWAPLIKIKDIYSKKNLQKRSRAEVYEDLKAIYVSIARNGSVSIKKAFRIKNPKIKIILCPDELHKFKDYLKFTFVRNPYHRIFSCYHGHVRKDYGGFKKYGIDSSLTFNQFIRKGKVENINKDYLKVCKILKIDKPAKIFKENQSIKPKLQIDNKTKRLIYDYYEKDFKLFGYEF